MSMHKTIIDAVKVAIDALATPPISVVRDRLVITSADIADLPLIVLTMGAETDEQYLFGGNVIRSYEVNLGIFYAQNQAIQTGIDDAKSRRELIRKAMIPDATSSLPLLGVTGVFDCDVANLPPQDVGKAGAGYEEATMLLRFRTSEAS